MSLTPFELEQLRAVAARYVEQAVDLTQRICAVPAPTGSERQRAEFVATLLRERGYQPEIDEIGNVYVRRGKRDNRPVVMLLAHTDTVFPLATPLKIVREGDILRGPGIGDNSLSVASMICLLDMLDAMNYQEGINIVAVADVGEEGLGNLRGARRAVERYRTELGAVIAIDGSLGHVVNTAVGSQRWRITVQGPGGHSFGAFGTPSAIHRLGKIIAAIADVDVPRVPKTTFNVGVIDGGTSVNTIAATASALLDMRSVDAATLAQLAKRMRQIVHQSVGSGVQVEIEVLGDRPCGKRSSSDTLVQLAMQCLHWLDREAQLTASSTDANIPLSLDIPAVCIGITHVEGAHTLNEWLAIPPIATGLAQLLRLCIEASKLST